MDRLSRHVLQIFFRSTITFLDRVAKHFVNKINWPHTRVHQRAWWRIKRKHLSFYIGAQTSVWGWGGGCHHFEPRSLNCFICLGYQCWPIDQVGVGSTLCTIYKPIAYNLKS